MKPADLAVLGLAALAVFFVTRARGITATRSNPRGLSPALLQQEAVFASAAGPLFPDTEAAYAGTWTATGPLNLATYDKQIYD